MGRTYRQNDQSWQPQYQRHWKGHTLVSRRWILAEQYFIYRQPKEAIWHVMAKGWFELETECKAKIGGCFVRIYIFKYFLKWFKGKTLNRDCTRENSSMVDCCDYLLENMKPWHKHIPYVLSAAKWGRRAMTSVLVLMSRQAHFCVTTAVTVAIMKKGKECQLL